MSHDGAKRYALLFPWLELVKVLQKFKDVFILMMETFFDRNWPHHACASVQQWRRKLGRQRRVVVPFGAKKGWDR